MKKFIFILIALFFFCPLVRAGITSLSGTFSHGQTITITGTGFGSDQSTYINYLDFEGGVNGNDISETDFTASSTGSAVNPRYTNTENFGPGSMSMYHNPTNEDGTSEIITYDIENPTFISWWGKRTYKTEVPGSHKPFRLEPSGGGLPLLGSGNNAGNYTIQLTTVNQNDNWSHTLSKTGVWRRYDAYLYHSGSVGWSGFNEYIPGSTVNDWDYENLDVGGSAGRFRLGQSCFVDSYAYIDDVYVQNGSRQRVEVCDNATWASRQTCIIQVPTSWSDTSIVITVKQGSHGASDTEYLYVVDDSDTVSASYEITYGQNYSATTTIKGVTIGK